MPMLTRAGRRRRQRAATATPATHQQHVLELSPVTAAVVRTMSLRGLIGIRGVSRAFRDAATQRLQTMERPVVGGGLPCEESCHTLETLNLATMEWELTPALCACRSEAACADIREEGGGWRLVLAGGDTLAESDSAELRGWSVTKAVFSYDPELRKWDSSMPPMRTGRTAARLVRLICGQLLAIGGCTDEEDHISAVEALKPGANEWVDLAPMRQPRHSFACGRLPSGEVVVAGGQNKAGKFLATAEIYDPEHNQWRELPDVPTNCRAAAYGWTRADGRFCVCGLGPAGTEVRTCYTLNLPSNTWEEVWEVNFEGRGHATGGCAAGAFIPVPGGCLLVAGSAANEPSEPSDDESSHDASRLDALDTVDLYDEETRRVYRLPHQLNFSRCRPFVHMATPPHRPLTAAQARQEQLGRCPVALGVATDGQACQCHDDGTTCEFDLYA